MKDDLIDIQELTTYLFGLLDKEENKAVGCFLPRNVEEDFNEDIMNSLMLTRITR